MIRSTSLRCFFTAWIFGWVVAIYLPSAVMALAGLSPRAEHLGFLAATLAIADAVAPAAKIGFAALSGALHLGARKWLKLDRRAATALDVLLSVLAMLIVVAVLPAAWSRGFGIGVAGSRFAPDLVLVYLVCAGASGAVFNLSEAKCLARRDRPPS